MFKFGKKEEKKPVKVDKNNTTSHGNAIVQTSAQSRSVQTRTVTNTETTQRYSFVSGTQTSGIASNLNPSNLFHSSGLRSTPNLNLNSSLKLKTEPKPQRSLSVFARPIISQTTNLPQLTTNYQSPFSRQLAPYNSARTPLTTASPARPILPNAQSNTVASVIPTYNTNGSKRGCALIINNIKFLQSKEQRNGAEIDENDVSKLFKDMGFNVNVHRNLKSSEMRNKIKKFSTDRALIKSDISVVIMMSHGNNKINDQVIPGNFTQIFGSDGEAIGIDDVLAEFSTEKCPGMKGKPKIFIFQCCRGDQTETVQVDAAPFKNVIKRHSDMLIAFSTLPGFFSLRDPEKGSWYIQSICNVFKKHAKEFDVETLLKIVDEELSRKHPSYKQTSTYESRGFKRCFLNPR